MKTTAKARPRKSARGSRRGFLRRLFRWAVTLVAAFYALCALGLLALRWLNPVTTSVEIERRVQALFRKGRYQKRYTYAPLGRISADLQHAVIAAEDTRFYQHHGIDWQELGKVVENDLDEGRLGRGASTITQQLVKNLFLTTRRSLIRKGVECTLVPPAEWILSKNRILELYLNAIEWGPGVFGAEAAAQYYYHVPAARLGREQAARLAACLPSPLRRKPNRMDSYSAEILDRMGKMGW